MLEQSELEIHLASAEAGEAMGRDHWDEENPLALVSEWERNLTVAQEKWRCRAVQRELERCMFWAWLLAGSKLFPRGFSVNAEMIYSKRADWVSWKNKWGQKICSHKREEKNVIAK